MPLPKRSRHSDRVKGTVMEIKLTEENFKNEVLECDLPVLVDFYADWCGPCRMLAPVLEEIAEENAETLTVAKVNVDEEEELAAQFRIYSIKNNLKSTIKFFNTVKKPLLS